MVKWCQPFWFSVNDNISINISVRWRQFVLTHFPLVPHICVSELGQHWFRLWLVACSAPSHYLNQSCPIINWTHGDNFQWNLNRNSLIFIQENAPENIVCQNGGRFVQGERSQIDPDLQHSRQTIQSHIGIGQPKCQQKTHLNNMSRIRLRWNLFPLIF